MRKSGDSILDRVMDFTPVPIEGQGETATPGVFYHGSPEVNIDAFRTVIENDGFETAGVFFSHSPTMAARFASKHGGGRVYSVSLNSKNPFFVTAHSKWTAQFYPGMGVEELRRAETSLIQAAKSEGWDVVVSAHDLNVFLEIVALRDEVIQRLDADIPPVPNWQQSQAIVDRLTFHLVEGLRGPDYAPDCIPLFASRKEAMARGGKCQRVIAKPIVPVYCERHIWPELKFDVLAEFAAKVDCLVCPRTGDALALDTDCIRPINRQQLKHLKAELRRSKRPANDKEQAAMSGSA